MSSSYNDLMGHKKPREVEVSYDEYKAWFDKQKKATVVKEEEPETSVSSEPKAKTREEEIEE